MQLPLPHPTPPDPVTFLGRPFSNDAKPKEVKLPDFSKDEDDFNRFLREACPVAAVMNQFKRERTL